MGALSVLFNYRRRFGGTAKHTPGSRSKCVVAVESGLLPEALGNACRWHAKVETHRANTRAPFFSQANVDERNFASASALLNPSNSLME
jgi:hypothetical protein